MDNEIMGFVEFGSATMFSTMDRMGLCVLLPTSEACTFHRSRKIGVDISGPELFTFFEIFLLLTLDTIGNISLRF